MSRCPDIVMEGPCFVFGNGGSVFWCGNGSTISWWGLYVSYVVMEGLYLEVYGSAINYHCNTFLSLQEQIDNETVSYRLPDSSVIQVSGPWPQQPHTVAHVYHCRLVGRGFVLLSCCSILTSSVKRVRAYMKSWPLPFRSLTWICGRSSIPI